MDEYVSNKAKSKFFISLKRKLLWGLKKISVLRTVMTAKNLGANFALTREPFEP